MFASAEPGPEHEALDAQLGIQATALLNASGREAISKTGGPLLEACRSASTAVQRRQEARRHDIASLVAMVRETVDSLSAGHTASAAALGETTTRLENLQRVSDFFELKELLAAEVVTLREIASDREVQHDKTVAAMRDRLKTAEEELCIARAEALMDALTEIPNRRAFDAALAQQVQQSTPYTTMVLALFDVDGFKGLNDRFGHPTGDAVLRSIARCLRDNVRQDDVVARIGGDEFALIASGLTLTQAESRLRAVLHAIAELRIGAEGVAVSVSCGASEHSAGDTVHTLLHRTDAALGDAKVLGKNRVVTRTVPYIRSLLRQGR
jgi:diguanylate cyclase (GGDEF)-like protein